MTPEHANTDLLRDMEARIKTIIHRQLQRAMHHVEKIALDTPILGKGLALDSMEALVLITLVDAEFDILTEDEELTRNLFKNIGTLAEHVKKKLSTNHRG